MQFQVEETKRVVPFISELEGERSGKGGEEVSGGGGGRGDDPQDS